MAMVADLLVSLVGLYIDVLATLFAGCEYYNTVNKSEQCVVFTHTYVKTWVVLSATLALDDVAGFAV
jgi:hypothetical protein